jgi:MoaA/NifB/PqqE/SkfB family radical SAM enzyme
VADGIEGNANPVDLDGIVQLEVTSRCNLSCPACPHGAVGDGLLLRDMSNELFDRVVDQTVRPGRRYHLQGWGEPLLRDDLPDLARSIVERGGLPSATTNGTLITPDLAGALVEAGLEFITISIAGGRPESQRSNRPGAELETVLGAFRELRRAKKRQRRTKPLLAASYELTRSSVGSLPDAIAKLKKAGAQRLIAINPILAITAAQESNLLPGATDPAEKKRMLRALRGAAVATMWRSLPYHCDPVEADPRPVCREDPLGSLFIGAGGDVSPCVFLGLPAQKTTTARMGSLRRSSLVEIWNGSEYGEFRKAFLARREAAQRGSPRAQSEPEPPLPEPCRGCLRGLGY